jgi:catechol 2,3-dioxygenase-like lactoylglutathione lyase family enzyme
MTTGDAPARGKSRLVPELVVTDIATSLKFWCGLVGFRILYDRPEQQFAYLELDGAEVMLEQRGSGAPERQNIWDTGPLERPFGRGINLQIQVSDVAGLCETFRVARWPIFFGPEERWYRNGTVEIGVRQFLVQDPDGYLLRLQQDIGTRTAAT